MSGNKRSFSRRSFVKGIGLAAVTPWLSQTTFGDEFSEIAGESFVSDSQIAPAQHRILTANIRVALPEDDAKGRGWSARKDICMDVIKAHKPDIIALQEVIKVQAEDMRKAFPGYLLLGFEGPEMDVREEGYQLIAKNPIMFSKKRYDLIGAGTYWLSDKPLIGGSLSWETGRARHVNWVRLKDKKSGTQFRLVNTHLDHVTQVAREHQIKTIIEECAQYKPDFKQILAGDFNAGAENTVIKLLKTAGWKDTYAAVHGDTEPGFTAHSWDFKRFEKTGGRKIDFIFTLGGIQTLESEIIKDTIKGEYPSDHYFLDAHLRF